ncbi:sigma-54 dependent transcriptional regulator [Chromobacterium sp. IIBBL 290-4]|uniref:sigma-54-dependent transcriptional regulator n=1 Tax=Chromobacterium sp. IIBBL 290-4 TaxID=2953890 RepID=UPI0020B8449E|nr:sigma-54 dependent transcriptional regulator [Chromobacterium sp. IIBBL 290-4]UTH75823.1 sigma-54 dependent transcriptional regulator [Chromobacterium sp. IIBBL 290-4]
MTKSAHRVLIVDDEPDIRELLELTLLKMGLQPVAAGSVGEARAALQAGSFDLALTDMRLPDGEGLEVVRHIAEQGLDLPIAVLTAFGSADNAVQAMKAGAFDYLQKPVSLAQLRSLVKSALKVDAPAAKPSAQKRLLGDSPAIQEVLRRVDKLARSQAAVYIRGESGTGKEQAARLIHETGPRAGRPFVAVNCGAIPENLMESEFFGYRKGAFTGADSERDGFFQQAQGGTLFLDEVADLPLAMQVKLLRAIQEKTVRKLGASQEEAADARIICATHQDLAALAEQGRFRQDLFYRLNVLPLQMPPLRELREDIPLLAERLLARFSDASAPARLAPDALNALQDYAFPGNFRELENILERAVALASSPTLRAEDLQLSPPLRDIAPPDGGTDLQQYLDQLERDAIVKALETTRYNRTQAAKRLGVTFRSLRYRMERLGIK